MPDIDLSARCQAHASAARRRRPRSGDLSAARCRRWPQAARAAHGDCGDAAATSRRQASASRAGRTRCRRRAVASASGPAAGAAQAAGMRGSAGQERRGASPASWLRPRRDAHDETRMHDRHVAAGAGTQAGPGRAWASSSVCCLTDAVELRCRRSVSGRRRRLAKASGARGLLPRTRAATATQAPMAEAAGQVYGDCRMWSEAADAMRQRTSELKKKAATSSEKATIEIVALMFQSILAEERIPPAVRVWFARLQMPVLRVAHRRARILRLAAASGAPADRPHGLLRDGLRCRGHLAAARWKSRSSAWCR